MLVPTLPADPYAVTDDTFVIPTIAAAPDGTFISAHSMIIRGAEPVIIDTGCSLVRDDWAERAFSVVEPAVIGHASHMPSPAPGAESQAASSSAPPHGAPILPAAHATGLQLVRSGMVERRVTSRVSKPPSAATPLL